MNTTCNGAGTCGSGCDADSDCLAGNYCTGTTGACAQDKPQGTGCAGDSIDSTGTHQCVAGLKCADGFCCNSDCPSTCQSCNGTKTGAATGTCANILAKSDPDNECSTGANTTCNAGVCGDACDADVDCNTTYFCNLVTTKCTARQAKGQPCNTNLKCLSGLSCVDGYCCDNACTGTCKSCDGSKSGGTNGTCTNIANKTDPDNECSTNPLTTCNGSGACGAYCDADADCGSTYYCASGTCTEKGDPSESCASNLQCKSGYCIKGKCCAGDCQGSCADCSTGTCKARPSGAAGDPACSPHLCNGTALTCGDSCNSDTQCASGYYCNAANQCVAQLAQGKSCNDDAGQGCLTQDCKVCATGHCVDNFCCNTACGGQCDACNGAVRGWTGKVNGTCAIAPSSFLGDPACSGLKCNGTDADCPDLCATDSDCDAAYYCNKLKKCVARKDNGQACDTAATGDCAVNGCRVCTSNNCVEGRCCNTPCSGACDSCAQSGVEGYCVNLAQGAPGTPSCAPFVCNGSLGTCPTTCVGDVQCASGAWCDNGTCKAVKQLGQSCSTSVECSSQFCVDGVCCASACVGACNQCDATGTCVLSTGPGSPSCNGILCDGAQADCPASCASDAACADGYFCAIGGSCQPRKALGQACNLNTDCAQAGCRECASDQCVDNFCCNSSCSGGCDTCSATPGTCTILGAKEIGLPPCSPYVCDGVGGSCPGTCTNDDVCAANAYCNGSACALKKSLGVACVSGSECLSTFCADGVCCDKPCSGACDVCGSNGECVNAPGTGAPSCAPYLCTGAESGCPLGCSSDSRCVQGYYCNGACTPKADLGQSCTAGSQCASGFCADSVCCNAACDGACDTCNLAGECVNVTGSGSPPCGSYLCTGMTSDCPTACVTDNQCADGYFCGTGGKCLLQKNPGQACNSATDCAQPGCRECVTGHCADGFCCDSACDAPCDECATTPGVCKFSQAGALGAPSCEPFVCSGAIPGCPDACASDQDCAKTSWCKGNVCVKKAETGQMCTTAVECLSGYCTDGVCCDKACAGQCEACDLPGSQAGNCSPVDGQPHGKREPCAAATGADKCSATTCKGTESRTQCVFVGADVTCVENSCKDGVATFATVCDGTGKCPEPTTDVCEPFVCKGTACGMAPCATDDDCAPKFKCNSKTQECISRDQSTCDGHIVTAADGKTSDDCSPYNCRVGPAGGECMTTCTSSVDCVETHVCELETEKCIARDVPPAESDEGGCGCRTAGAPRGPWSAIAFLAMALGAMLRRRRVG
ncbi:MAG TPA: MYXO-CTERM sorting domain-containing protein [Polyangiaceae bacterium]|nr:MYXO-CTERM sorting domain-containing protein [Polyangiaceae bacterium]